MNNRRPVSPREARKETRAIWAIIVIVLVVIAIAAYGYFSGDWQSTPP